MPRGLRIGLIVAATLVAVLILGVLFVSYMNPGRELVRRQIVAILQDNSKGIIRVEGLSGNILGRFRLIGVAITDSAGRPLLLADTIATDYGFRALLGRRVNISRLRLVRPLIVVERFPGEDWNFNRIFPRDTIPAVEIRPGWGTWIRFSDILIQDGRFIARVPWTPNELLTPAQREAEITAALGVDARTHTVRVPGGFQRVHDFRHIDARIPLARLADPDFDHALIEIEALRTEAYPYRPPGLTVSALTTDLRFNSDSLWWRDARAQLSGSRVALDGSYRHATGDLSLRLIANPMNPADARWIFPELPRSGVGRMEFAFDWSGDSLSYVARNLDIRMEGAHIRGSIGMTDADTVVFHRGTNLRFAGLHTDQLRRWLGLDFPRRGTLNGFAHFAGGMNALQVNGDVSLTTAGGTSRMLSEGVIGFPEVGFTFRDLRIRMDPVTADLARVMIEDIPFDGVFTGLATVNGSTAGLVTALGDVTHVEAGRQSRAIGRVDARPEAADPWFDVSVRLAPAALATVGQFAPELGLRGFVSGPLHVTGTVNDLRMNTRLAASGGGEFHLRGRLAPGGREPGYDLALDTYLFDASAISARAPSTSLIGTARAFGVGVDPATMRGRIEADMRTSVYDTVAVDSVIVRVTMADGLATLDTLSLHLPAGFAEAAGTIGLVEHREGEFGYRVEIDSLEAFAGLIGGEPGEVRPRPGVVAQRMEQARADSALRAERTEVERMVTGAPPPELQVDTPRTIERDEVSGSLRAEGTGRGNIQRLAISGTAQGEDVTARGQYVQAFGAEYEVTNLGRRDSRVGLRASMALAQVGGFEFDTVRVILDHAATRGRAQIAARQDDLRLYAADADYVLHADHNELHLNQLRLQFDTTVWESVRPSAIQWGRAGVTVQDLELTAGEGRRVFVSGLLPTEGVANLDVAVTRFELGDIAALLQADADARGLIDLDARVTGTAAAPVITGTTAIEDFRFRDNDLPRVQGTFSYQTETITGTLAATRADGTMLVQAEGTIPINLAFTDVAGPRIPLDRSIDLLVQADSFPVEIIPAAEELVSDVSGLTQGTARITGTLRSPEVAGEVIVADAGFRVVPAGIRLVGVMGRIQLATDTLVIDSLVGRSAGGLVRLQGGVGIRNIAEPSFDLSLFTRGARVLDNEYGRIRADAQLAAYGAFRDVFVSGGVRLHDGVINIPEPDDKHVIGAGDPGLYSVIDTAVAAERELFPAQSPLLANLEVDVHLRVDRDVFVRSRDANIEVYTDGDLIVRADRARELLTLDGLLLSDRGDYFFLQKRFRIRRGSATFVGLSEINPTLQVTGEYEVRLPAREAINIEIIIGGTLRSPRIEMRSNAQPPLSQTDLLSYLAFGRPSSSLTQLEGASLTSGSAGGSLIGQGAALAMQQMATVAVGTMADEFAGEVARSLGADVFIITPADVGTDIGSFLRSTEVEFGRYIRPETFVALQARPDPASLRRPGFNIDHRFRRPQGFQLRFSLGPRYTLREPTLADREPQTRSVFGAFLIREWRY